ncbi:hypothetical protein ACJ41O_012817 [Fusarium nematophilum]
MEDGPCYERVQFVPLEIQEHVAEVNTLLFAVAGYLNIPREEMWMDRETLMLDWEHQEQHLRKLKAGGTLDSRPQRHPPKLGKEPKAPMRHGTPLLGLGAPGDTPSIKSVEPLKEILVSDGEQLFTGTLEDLDKMMLRAAGVICRKSTGWSGYCKDCEMHIERFGERTNERAKTALEALFRIKDCGFPPDESELNVNTVTCLEFLDEQIAMCKKIEETLNNPNPWRLDTLVHLEKARIEYDEKYGPDEWYTQSKWKKITHSRHPRYDH